MNFDDDTLRTDAADTTDVLEADDYPIGMLASPTRIQL
ncbi:MAG: hypothetical protein JWN84_83 [Nocardioides sp.]|nr:hypothetical protein [Nocardioides sp.]